MPTDVRATELAPFGSSDIEGTPELIPLHRPLVAKQGAPELSLLRAVVTVHPSQCTRRLPSTSEMHAKRAESSGILSPSDEISSYHESYEDDPLIPLDPRAAEKRLLRKLDGRILPITCILYLFACESFVVWNRLHPI